MSERKPPRPSDDPDAEPGAEWVGPRTTLDAEGRLVRPATPPAAPPDGRRVRPAPSTPVPEFGSELGAADLGSPHGDEPLQLMERPESEAPAEPPRLPGDGFVPLPGRYQAPPRRRLFPVAVAVFVLVIGGAAVWVLLGGQGLIPRGWLPRSVQVPQGLEQQVRVLTIDSTPSGATVFIDGVNQGQTPLLKENAYAPDAQVKVRLVRKGYRPWTGTFRGGAEAKIEARLVKR